MRKLLVLLMIIANFATVANPVDKFYSYAVQYGLELTPKTITVLVEKLPDANGRIDKMPDGSLRIIIEDEFYNYYGPNSPQVERLVFYLLGHAVLNKPHGKGIMNANQIYKPMRKRHLDKLFKYDTPISTRTPRSV